MSDIVWRSFFLIINFYMGNGHCTGIHSQLHWSLVSNTCFFFQGLTGME